MQSNLPPVIVDMIQNVKDKKQPANVRFNYMIMLKNIAKEISTEVSKVEIELETKYRSSRGISI